VTAKGLNSSDNAVSVIRMHELMDSLDCFTELRRHDILTYGLYARQLLPDLIFSESRAKHGHALSECFILLVLHLHALIWGQK
jgi:hypothetical protein